MEARQRLRDLLEIDEQLGQNRRLKAMSSGELKKLVEEAAENFRPREQEVD